MIRQIGESHQSNSLRMLMACATVLVCAILAAGCDQISSAGDSRADISETPGELLVAGSSTMAPFVTSAAEYFGAMSAYPTPIVETTGTGGGFRIFCRDTHLNASSIATASRRMTDGERALCEQNGVEDIAELKFGYDGIVVANALRGPDIDFTRQDLYLALAKYIWTEDGFVPNPHKNWSDIREELPDLRIEVFGPPPTSGTRDAFVDIVIEAAARDNPALQHMEETEPERFQSKALTLRTDGVWTDAGENDTQIIQSLIRNPNAFGLIGFSYLKRNADRLRAAEIDGLAPDFENIANGDYTITRSLYIYVKERDLHSHEALVPFVIELYSDTAIGDHGYLVEKGLIPLKPGERQQALAQIRRLELAQTPRSGADAPG